VFGVSLIYGYGVCGLEDLLEMLLVDEKVPSVHFRTLNLRACLFESRMYRVFRSRPFDPVRVIVMWPFVTSVESLSWLQ
jgi:hypothetical protein